MEFMSDIVFREHFKENNLKDDKVEFSFWIRNTHTHTHTQENFRSIKPFASRENICSLENSGKDDRNKHLVCLSLKLIFIYYHNFTFMN